MRALFYVTKDAGLLSAFPSSHQPGRGHDWSAWVIPPGPSNPFYVPDPPPEWGKRDHHDWTKEVSIRRIKTKLGKKADELWGHFQVCMQDVVRRSTSFARALGAMEGQISELTRYWQLDPDNVSQGEFLEEYYRQQHNRDLLEHIMGVETYCIAVAKAETPEMAAIKAKRWREWVIKTAPRSAERAKTEEGQGEEPADSSHSSEPGQDQGWKRPVDAPNNEFTFENIRRHWAESFRNLINLSPGTRRLEGPVNGMIRSGAGRGLLRSPWH